MAQPSISLEWVKDPQPILKNLRRGMRNKIVRPAVVKTTQQMVPDIKRAAPKDHGAMKVSIGRRVYTSKKGSKSVLGVVGPKSNFERPVKKRGKIVRRGNRAHIHRRGESYTQIPAKYAHLVERGHRFPKRRKGSALRKAVRAVVRALGGGGRVKPHPFLAPTFKRNRGRYQETMTNWLRAGIRERLSAS